MVSKAGPREAERMISTPPRKEPVPIFPKRRYMTVFLASSSISCWDIRNSLGIIYEGESSSLISYCSISLLYVYYELVLVR